MTMDNYNDNVLLVVVTRDPFLDDHEEIQLLEGSWIAQLSI